MRAVLVAVLAVALMAGVAFADQTDGANYVSPNGSVHPGLLDFLNEQECLDHNHNYNVPDRDDPLGIGVDTVVYQDENPDAKLEEVVIETRHDFENEETSVFAVARFNLFKIFNK